MTSDHLLVNSLPYISTHTPLAGRDWNVLFKTNSNTKFLLTRPLRDVTLALSVLLVDLQISTHTPLAGRDYDFVV